MADDSTWPVSSYGRKVYDELLGDLHDRTLQLDVTGMALNTGDASFPVGGVLSYELPKDNYSLFLGYQYNFLSKTPYEFDVGVALRRSWGEFRFGLFTGLPSITETGPYGENWNVGASVQAIYDLVSTKYVRLGLMGEAGYFGGEPDVWASRLGAGLVMTTRFKIGSIW